MRSFVALGSNLGDRAANLRLGVEVVAADDPCSVSHVYETSPVGGPDQGPFLNCVVGLDSPASPRELLERCREAERRAERVRTVANGPRTLDADVLLVGDLVVDEPDLVVPHPRMWTRRFVLQPLSDLAPELVDDAVLAAVEGEVVDLGTLSAIR